MNLIRITLEDGTCRRCRPHTPAGTLLKKRYDAHGLPFIGARVNNDIVSLTYRWKSMPRFAS